MIYRFDVFVNKQGRIAIYFLASFWHSSQGQSGSVHFPQSWQMSQVHLGFLQVFFVFVQGQGIMILCDFVNR